MDAFSVLLYHLICTVQDGLWNGEADLFRSLQVNDQLELRWSLHRQISRLCTFEDSIHVIGGAPVQVGIPTIRSSVKDPLQHRD